MVSSSSPALGHGVSSLLSYQEPIKRNQCGVVLVQRHLIAGDFPLYMSKLSIWVTVLFLGPAMIRTSLEETQLSPASNHCNDSSSAASRLNFCYRALLFGY